MGKTWRWIAVAVALAAVAASPVWAQNEMFRYSREYNAVRQTPDATMRLIGNAKYVVEGAVGRIRLTDDSGQASGFFIGLPFALSDYEIRFDFEVRRVSPGETPADGFMFVAKTGDPNRIGNGGGALGYARSDTLTLPSSEIGGGIPGYSYGVEFNSWPAQGLPGAAETVGIDVLGLRTRFSQTPFRVVDRGWVRLAIRVKPEGLTVRVLTGTGSQTILQSPGWMGGFFNPPAPLFLGFTAATGGARQIVDIYYLQLLANQPL